MVNGHLSLRKNYWETLEITPKDIGFLNNHLFELETPLSTQELTRALVSERIRLEKHALKNQQTESGKIYYPKDQYKPGEVLIFPALDWQSGTVVNVRAGKNPEITSFEVIEVEMARGNHRQFAASLAEHRLNQPIEVKIDDELLDLDTVLQNNGERINALVEKALIADPELICVARKWFPRALLVDVNIGHLNLAEAVLDMANGGPLHAKSLIEQIDLPTDVNPELREFSLNYALQADARFDEVGPTGEVLWFLHRLEPEPVQHTPLYLRCAEMQYDRAALPAAMQTLERQLDDEMSNVLDEPTQRNEAVVILTYPHWRAGTLPLTARTSKFFPTALEAPRIQFLFADAESGATFPGWVVRPDHYVYGLREWYVAQGLVPGSLLHIKPGKNPGEVQVFGQKRRAGREWIRTVLIGADGGIVFAILKQMVSAVYDERMAIMISDVEALDQVWDNGALLHIPMEQVVLKIMRELSKLNPQGHVHAQELYAAVNVVRRCPPGPIFNILLSHPAFNLVGDLYFRLETTTEEV